MECNVRTGYSPSNAGMIKFTIFIVLISGTDDHLEWIVIKNFEIKFSRGKIEENSIILAISNGEKFKFIETD